MYLSVCVYVCECVPTLGQGGAARSWLPLAPTDLPACGFENQIIGLEAAEQLPWALQDFQGSLESGPGGGGRAGCGVGTTPLQVQRLSRGGGRGKAEVLGARRETQTVRGSLPPARPGPLLSLTSSNRYLWSTYPVPGLGPTAASRRAVPGPISLPARALGQPLHRVPLRRPRGREGSGGGGYARARPPAPPID